MVVKIEYLYVEGFVNSLMQWVTSGASPWLNAVEGLNYITGFVNNSVARYFTFQQPTGTKNPKIVTLQVYARMANVGANCTVECYFWDGTQYVLAGSLTVSSTSYSWVSLTGVASIVDTLTKLQSTRVYFKYKSGSGVQGVDFDCARLYIGYRSASEIRADKIEELRDLYGVGPYPDWVLKDFADALGEADNYDDSTGTWATSIARYKTRKSS